MKLFYQIQDYINYPKDYQLGILLLTKITKKRSLVNHLMKSNNEWNKKKMLYELKKWLNTTKYEQQNEKEAITLQTEEYNIGASNENSKRNKQNINKEISLDVHTKHPVIVSPSINNNNVFQAIEKYKKQRNELYALRDSYHGQLHSAATKKLRLDLAIKIIKLQPKIDFYNRKIKELISTGKLSKSEESLLSTEKYKRLQLLKKYVRRYKLKVNNSKTLESKQKSNNKLELYQSEIKTILNE